MDASPRRRRRRAATVAGLAIACGAWGTAAARADGPVQLSSQPITEDQSWKSHVLADGASDVTPVRVTSTSGDVTNPQGLVDPSKGPTTLNWTAGTPAPIIVLDYGREVGGLPYFNVGSATPVAPATSVSLRSAYSETLQYLYTAGSSTLALPAAAGDTNIKLGSVANFLVGDTIKVDQESAKIAAVGTQARSTTLFTAAAAGDTNVKVAATTGIAAGDTLRVDTAAGTESVTVSNVGTQGRNTTLSAATAAGATNVKVASVTGLAAGDTLNIDTGAALETRTIQTVGTAGPTAPASL